MWKAWHFVPHLSGWIPRDILVSETLDGNGFGLFDIDALTTTRLATPGFGIDGVAYDVANDLFVVSCDDGTIKRIAINPVLAVVSSLVTTADIGPFYTNPATGIMYMIEGGAICTYNPMTNTILNVIVQPGNTFNSGSFDTANNLMYVDCSNNNDFPNEEATLLLYSVGGSGIP